jgi:hypothetical protein
VVALERAERLCLVEDARARADKLLVELPLVVASVPALPIQRLEALATHVDPLKRAHGAHNLAPLAKLLHRTHGNGRCRGEVQSMVGLVDRLEREGGRHMCAERAGVYINQKNKSAQALLAPVD